jgi:hypothetical protein
VETIRPAAPTTRQQDRPSGAAASLQAEAHKNSDIEHRIRSAVLARLGNQVDGKLLDNIIHRVVKGVGLK